MKHSIKFLFLFLIIYNFTYGQDIIWVNKDSATVRNPNNLGNYATKIDLDNNNNIYVGGQFKGQFSDSSYNYLSDNGKINAFVGKINKKGKLEWLNKMGSDNHITISGIKTIANTTTVIGYYTDNIYFQTPSSSLTSYNSSDVFITKYNNIDGSDVAGGQINLAYGPNKDLVYSFDIDNSGNIIMAGRFKDTIYFNNQAGDLSDYLYNNSSTYDMYIAKFDANGIIIWYKHITGTNNYIFPKSLECSTDGCVIATYYKGDVTTDLGTLSHSNTIVNSFLYKIDLDGNGQWIREMYGNNHDYIRDITIDNDTIYTFSYYSSTDLTVDSTSTLTSNISIPNKGGSDFMLNKYLPNGTLQWTKYFGSTGNEIANNMNFNNNRILLSGSYGEELIIENDTLQYNAGKEACLLIFENNSSYIGSYAITGTEDEQTVEAIIDNDNNYIVSGDFTSDIIYIGENHINGTDTITKQDTLINGTLSPNRNMFFLKFGCFPNSITFNYDSINCPGEILDSLIAESRLNWYDYNYTWTMDEDASFTGNNDTLLNLEIGHYNLSLKNAFGCTYDTSIYLTHRPILQAILVDTLTVDCEASNNGVAIITPSLGYKGVNGYTYTWDTGESDSTATQLTVGKHYVTVQDACGISTQVVDSINVGHLPKLTASIDNRYPIVPCDTTTTGSGKVNYNDGKAPYTFTWENSASTTNIANDLNVGWHYVTVNDFCNVPIVDSIKVINIPTISSQITFSQKASCLSTLDGSAKITAFNGVEPYSYSWSASAAIDTNYVDDLPANTLVYVTVSDICH